MYVYYIIYYIEIYIIFNFYFNVLAISLHLNEYDFMTCVGPWRSMVFVVGICCDFGASAQGLYQFIFDVTNMHCWCISAAIIWQKPYG